MMAHVPWHSPASVCSTVLWMSALLRTGLHRSSSTSAHCVAMVCAADSPPPAAWFLPLPFLSCPPSSAALPASFFPPLPRISGASGGMGEVRAAGGGFFLGGCRRLLLPNDLGVSDSLVWQGGLDRPFTVTSDAPAGGPAPSPLSTCAAPPRPFFPA